MYVAMSRILEQVPPVRKLTYSMLFVVTHGGTGGDVMHFIRIHDSESGSSTVSWSAYVLKSSSKRVLMSQKGG